MRSELGCACMQPCLGFCFLYFEACWLAGRDGVCACGALLPWVVCKEFCLDGYFVVPCYFFPGCLAASHAHPVVGAAAVIVVVKPTPWQAWQIMSQSVCTFARHTAGEWSVDICSPPLVLVCRVAALHVPCACLVAATIWPLGAAFGPPLLRVVLSVCMP